MEIFFKRLTTCVIIILMFCVSACVSNSSKIAVPESAGTSDSRIQQFDANDINDPVSMVINEYFPEEYQKAIDRINQRTRNSGNSTEISQIVDQEQNSLARQILSKYSVNWKHASLEDLSQIATNQGEVFKTLKSDPALCNRFFEQGISSLPDGRKPKARIEIVLTAVFTAIGKARDKSNPAAAARKRGDFPELLKSHGIASEEIALVNQKGNTSADRCETIIRIFNILGNTKHVKAHSVLVSLMQRRYTPRAS